MTTLVIKRAGSAAAATITLALAGAPSALAQQTWLPSPGAYSFAIVGGADFVVDGDVHGGVQAPIADLGGLNPDLAGVAATLDIGSRDYDDVYGEIWSIGGEFGFGIDSRSELYGRVTYMEASGDELQVGGAVVPALNTTLPVLGRFDDYSAWSVEAGYRFFLADFGGFVPYAGVRGGILFVDDINATFTIPDAAIALNDVAFYDGSEVATVGLEIGAVYALSDTLGIGVETGLIWSDKLSDDDSAIGPLGLASINDDGDRLSIPVKAVLRGRF